MPPDALPLALTVFAALVLFQAISYIQTYRNRRRLIRSNRCEAAPHYPHAVPFLGTDIVREHKNALDQHCYMENMRKEFLTFGRTWQFTNFGGEVIHTMDPVIIESAMSRDSKSWGVAPIRYRGGKPFLGEGIFTLDGPLWKHARNQIKPALARSQFSNFHLLEVHVLRFLNLVPKDGTKFDLSALATRLMIDFSTEYFLGESLHSLAREPSDKAKNLLASLEVCLEGTFQGISQSMFFGRLAAFFIGSQKFKEACSAVHSFVRERMSEAIRVAGEDTGRRVLINELVHDTADEKLILSTATTFYSAGTDTSSIAIATALFLLSRHPSALSKARAEVLAMANGPPDIDTLKKMHYVRAVIDETLRLYPVGPTAQRTALVDTVLPTGGGLNGKSPIFVKKGTMLVISYYALHRDTQVWGEDAADFKPERWENDNHEAWTYQAFGGGLRACPGQQLALAIVAYVLTRILQEFKDIKNCDDRPWKESLGLTLCNLNGVHVAVTPT